MHDTQGKHECHHAGDVLHRSTQVTCSAGEEPTLLREPNAYVEGEVDALAATDNVLDVLAFGSAAFCDVSKSKMVTEPACLVEAWLIPEGDDEPDLGPHEFWVPERGIRLDPANPPSTTTPRQPPRPCPPQAPRPAKSPSPSRSPTSSWRSSSLPCAAT